MPDDNEPRVWQAYGEDTLTANVYGDDLPGLRMAALDKARKLYGPDAVLQIEAVQNIGTSIVEAEFRARVIVRRIDGGDEWIPPIGGPDAEA